MRRGKCDEREESEHGLHVEALWGCLGKTTLRGFLATSVALFMRGSSEVKECHLTARGHARRCSSLLIVAATSDESVKSFSLEPD